MDIYIKGVFILLLSSLMQFSVWAQDASAATERDYYKIITIPAPEGILLEVGGLATLPDGRIALCTRRGEVWVVEDPYMQDDQVPHFTLFASGLHEPLGLACKGNSLYAAQRGELTRMEDIDGDGKADVFETIYAWPLSGNYHEYSYGPKFAPDGSMFVSCNLGFWNDEWWRGESRVPWRGWIMHIFPDGSMEPWATGMRSPCGLGMIDGELFYDDNQGDWIASGGLWHVTKGSFTGHPAGLRWTGFPESPVDLTEAQFLARIDERRVKKSGVFIKPENIMEEKEPNLLFQVKEDFREIRLPAVWLPHGVLGISNSEILKDETQGAFGPFAGQLFVGDQGQSKIMRVDLEKVKGQYQGVAFDFRSGFQSGVLRLTWGGDGSLFVGETNRGWGSVGTRDSGLERLVWAGKVPMEMKTVKAMPDGFEITFTREVDRTTAEDLDSYAGRSFTYKYHPVYGSPTINEEALQLKGVKVSEDGLKARLVVGNLRRYYIHHLEVPGIRSRDGNLPVLHASAYYTLNNRPDGDQLSFSELSTKRSLAMRRVPQRPNSQANSNHARQVPTYDEVKPLLDKNTCLACHQISKRQVGPAFSQIAKRRYSNEKIVELIYSPQSQNWPDYATKMAPMPQVPLEEALKIASWINSLREEHQ